MALTKFTVNLPPKAVAALDFIVEHGGVSKTDGTAQALQLYAWWIAQDEAGLAHYTKDAEGNLTAVVILS
jgi:hypothetical protein